MVINFDPAGGILKKEVDEISNPFDNNEGTTKLKKQLASFFEHNPEKIILGNNETSTLHHILLNLNIKNATLIATNHEYIGLTRMFEGKNISKFITKPTSNMEAGIPFPKRKFIKNKFILDYEELEKFKKQITKIAHSQKNTIFILVSHVSRITGEIFPVKEIFKLVRTLNEQPNGAELRGIKGKKTTLID